MTLYPPLLLEAKPGDTPITYHAQDFRNMISAITPNSGVIRAGDLLVSQRAAGANVSVDVAAGRAIVPGTVVANEGTYIVTSDATFNVPLQTPSSSNPRIDLIVAQVYDAQADGGTKYSWTPLAVAGTPAGTPVAPATPANSLLLATVYVPANATSIVNTGTNTSGGTGSITDKRTLSGTGDVPKWDMANTQGTAQTVANNTDTIYKPSTHFQSIGVTVDPTLAAVTIITPGRYVVHFSARLTAGGSGPRTAFMRLYDTNGTTVLRNIGNTVVAATREPMAVSGTMYAAAGQIIKAQLYQNTGGTLSVDDGFLDNNFTGVWVGP
jgi:hypothetical protein